MLGRLIMPVIVLAVEALLGISAATLLFLSSGNAAAALIAVDADPSRAGIQSNMKAFLGATFQVDVVVADIDASDALNAFEFDLDFDPAVLSAVRVVSGNFLEQPAFVIEEDVLSPDINFAEFSFGVSGALGGGVLASIGFSADAVGRSPLVLNDVILSAPFGVQIADVEIIDGAVNIPEPPPVLGLALFLFAWFARSIRCGRSP